MQKLLQKLQQDGTILYISTHKISTHKIGKRDLANHRSLALCDKAMYAIAQLQNNKPEGVILSEMVGVECRCHAGITWSELYDLNKSL